MNTLIFYLLAIQNFNKDIHYSCHGDNFFGDHLLVDKFDFDYIDTIKEACILGNGEEPLSSRVYLQMAMGLIPEKTRDTNTNFRLLQDLVAEALNHIENIKDLSKGDENLVGAIAQDLQQYHGLLNLRNS